MTIEINLLLSNYENYHGELSFDLSQNPAFKLPNKNTKLLDCYELLKVIKNVKEKK